MTNISSACVALCALLLWCALSRPAWPQRPSQTEIIKGESRVLVRGDLEILTYETEENFRGLEELYEQSQKSAPVPGALTMRYLRSRTDGSVQPYALWLPRDYDPARTYPLLIQLHGIGPKQLAGRRHLWKGMGIPEWIDVHTPVIIAQCYGRGNTFYQGMGEVDVLETIDEIQRRFTVDADRIFIMGHSMGGAGSYTLGLHHPNRFGSITPIDPAMGSRITPQDDAEAPEWMKPQVAINSFARLYPNARNVNVFFKNAGAGIGGNSTQYTDGIVAQGGFSTTESFPGLPHHFAPIISYAIFIPQAIVQPIKRHPPEVRFYTNTLRYNRAYWVTIDRLTRHNEHSLVTASFDDGKPRPQPGGRPGAQQTAPPPEPRPPSISVATTNIDALTLRLAGGVVPRGLELPLKVDGQQVLSGPMPEIIHLSKNSGAWRVVEAAPIGRGKRHGVQGPIGDAFNSKFLAVYGEGDRALAVAELDALRNPPGRLVIHGDFPVKPAAKVTRKDIESSNLILFGTPDTNAVLKRIAGSLPKQLIEPQGDGASAVFIYPNPENPERYVVVWTTGILSLPGNGLSAGYILPVNLLPDYALVEEGRIVSAGHFDSEWRPSTVDRSCSACIRRGSSNLSPINQANFSLRSMVISRHLTPCFRI